MRRPIVAVFLALACGGTTPPPPAPELFRAVPGAARQILVTWFPVTEADHYLLHWRLGDGAESTATVNAPEMRYVLAGLQPGDTYSFSLQVVDAAGRTSDRTAVVTVTVPPAPQTAVLPSDGGPPNGYYEYLPPGYGDGVARPLLVFLHGSGANGDGRGDLDRVNAAGPPYLINTGSWPAARPFIVLSPQTALGCPTAAQVKAFLDFALTRYAVDPKRVFLTGLSCGAIGIWDYLGMYLDSQVAAAVLTAGDPGSAWVRAGCNLGLVALAVFHGTADDSVRIGPEQDLMRSLIACPSPPRREVVFTPVQGGGHDVWSDVYAGVTAGDVFEWLLAHAKP